ncbi:MAG TPA: SIMPL domain-containing protein [Gemmatimonadaceae bacterium]
MKRTLLAAFCLIPVTLYGQQPNTPAPLPQISTTSRGEVKVVPDRANVQISVQTRAETAAAAGTENARKQKAVIDALRALGIDAKDISTTGYNVYPEQRYEPNKEPVVVGYNVTNTVSVELKSINMVGQAIDAALGKGANMISSLQFYSSNTDSARKQAIALAVQQARADAEAAARAAGGSISYLLEINVGGYYPPSPQPIAIRTKMDMAAAQAATPISAGEQTVAVDVTTRWYFTAR